MTLKVKIAHERIDSEHAIAVMGVDMNQMTTSDLGTIEPGQVGEFNIYEGFALHLIEVPNGKLRDSIEAVKDAELDAEQARIDAEAQARSDAEEAERAAAEAAAAGELTPEAAEVLGVDVPSAPVEVAPVEEVPVDVPEA